MINYDFPPSYLVRMLRTGQRVLVTPLREWRPSSAWSFAMGAAAIDQSVSDALHRCHKMLVSRRL